MGSNPLLRYVIVGSLQRDYILTQSGKASLDIPGGSLFYTSSGLGVWERAGGMVGHINSDYPTEWLNRVAGMGFDTSGIRPSSESLDHRFFAAYKDSDHPEYNNPVSHFARLGIPFPRSLLGYQPRQSEIDSRTQVKPLTIRASDIPELYLDATAAHLCPLDYLSHIMLPTVFRQGQIQTITIDPSDGYMNPTFWDVLPALLAGITAFIPSEEKLANLFIGHSSDPWEMAEMLCQFGCEMVVIRRGTRGQYLYVHANRARWMVPAYPSRAVDPTGAGYAFCGGFLSGYRNTYDPVEAVLYGNISASLVIEGSGPFFALDALSGLAQARLDSLRSTIRRA
jgi:hypothetical protein